MLKLVIKVVVIVFLVGIVYVATNNSTSIRQQLNGAKSAVAGASTSETLETSLPTQLKEDTQHQIENLQEQVLEVKVGEIFSFFSRAGKIIDDFHNVQRNVSEKLEDKNK